MFVLTWTITQFCFRNSIKKTHLKTYPPPLHWEGTLINFLEECLQEKGCRDLVELRHWKSSSSGFVNTDFIKQVSVVLPCSETLHHLLQMEGSWLPHLEQVCGDHFPISICSLCISVSRFGNSHVISSPPPAENISTPWRLRWWSTFLSTEVFFN